MTIDILSQRVGVALLDDLQGGSTPYHVTHAGDIGAGSYRVGVEAGGNHVVFDDDFDFTLLSPVEPGPGTTIDCRDIDGNPKVIVQRGKSLHIINTDDVIVYNLIIRDIAGSDDGIQIRGATTKAWIHHVTVGDPSDNVNDGLIDIVDNARVTVSYTRFRPELDTTADRAMLCGNNQSGDPETDEQNCLVTLHRCWFDDTRTRNPGNFGARVHVWECLIENWSLGGVQTHAGGHSLISGTVFNKTGSSNASKAYGMVADYGTRIVKQEGCGHLGLSSGVEVSPGSCFTPPYSYSFTDVSTDVSDVAAENLAALIRAQSGAGVLDGPTDNPEQREVLQELIAGAEQVNTALAQATLSVTFTHAGVGGVSKIPQGTVLIFEIYARGASTTTITPPAGCVELVPLESSPSSSNKTAVYAKVAGANEPYLQEATIQTNNGGAGSDVTGLMIASAVSGLATDDLENDVIDVVGAVVINSVSSAAVVAPGVTVADNLSLLLGFYANVISDRTFTGTDWDTEDADINAGTFGLTVVDGTLAMYHEEVDAGATGTRTATCSVATSTNLRGVIIALKPMMIEPSGPPLDIEVVMEVATASADALAAGMTTSPITMNMETAVASAAALVATIVGVPIVIPMELAAATGTAPAAAASLLVTPPMASASADALALHVPLLVPVPNFPGAAAIEAGLSGPTVATRWRWERRTLSYLFRDDITNARDANVVPTITLDNNRAVLRDISGIELLGAELPVDFDPTSDNIAVIEERFIDGYWVSFPLGLFRLAIGDERHGDDGETIVECEASDLSIILEESGPATIYEIAAATNYRTAVQDVLNPLGLIHDLIDPAADIPVSVSFPPWPETSWGDILRQIAAGVQFSTPRPSTTGIFRWATLLYPDSEPIAVSYSDTMEPRLIDADTEYRRRVNAGTLPNRCIVTIDDPRRQADGVLNDYGSYVRENSDPTSPVSTTWETSPGLMRPVRPFDLDSDSDPSTKCILNGSIAVYTAQRELQLSAGEYRTADLTTFPDPRRGEGETYALTMDGVEAATKWRCLSWSRSLEPGGLMSHRLASVVDVELTDPEI